MSTSPFSPPPLPLSLKPHSLRRVKNQPIKTKRLSGTEISRSSVWSDISKAPPKHILPWDHAYASKVSLQKKRPLPATLLENKDLPPNLTAHRNRVFSFFCLATPRRIKNQPPRNRVFSFFCLATPRSKRPLPATLLENKDLPPNLIAHRNRVFSFFYLATPRRIKTNHQKMSEALPKLSFLPSRR